MYTLDVRDVPLVEVIDPLPQPYSEEVEGHNDDELRPFEPLSLIDDLAVLDADRDSEEDLIGNVLIQTRPQASIAVTLQETASGLCKLQGSRDNDDTKYHQISVIGVLKERS